MPFPGESAPTAPTTTPALGDQGTFNARLEAMFAFELALLAWFKGPLQDFFDNGTLNELVGTIAGGAAFEAGQNANGNFLRFQTGDVVAWHSVNLTYSLNSTLQATWTFPLSFDAAPAVVMTPQSGNFTPTFGELGQFRATPVTSTNATLAINRFTGATNFEAADDLDAFGVAFGRKTA